MEPKLLRVFETDDAKKFPKKLEWRNDTHSPVTFAASCNARKILKRLFKNKTYFNKHEKTKHGENALTVALRFGHWDLAMHLQSKCGLSFVADNYDVQKESPLRTTSQLPKHAQAAWLLLHQPTWHPWQTLTQPQMQILLAADVEHCLARKAYNLATLLLSQATLKQPDIAARKFLRSSASDVQTLVQKILLTRDTYMFDAAKKHLPFCDVLLEHQTWWKIVPDELFGAVFADLPWSNAQCLVMVESLFENKPESISSMLQFYNPFAQMSSVEFASFIKKHRSNVCAHWTTVPCGECNTTTRDAKQKGVARVFYPLSLGISAEDYYEIHVRLGWPIGRVASDLRLPFVECALKYGKWHDACEIYGTHVDLDFGTYIARYHFNNLALLRNFREVLNLTEFVRNVQHVHVIIPWLFGAHYDLLKPVGQVCVRENRLDIMKLPMMSMSSVECRTRWLREAGECGSSQMCMLLCKNFQSGLRREDPPVILVSAVQFARTQTLRCLLELGGFEVRDLYWDKGESLIHYAAHLGHLDIVKFLSLALDPRENDVAMGWNVFDFALDRGHMPVVKWFCQTYTPPLERILQYPHLDHMLQHQTAHCPFSNSSPYLTTSLSHEKFAWLRQVNSAQLEKSWESPVGRILFFAQHKQDVNNMLRIQIPVGIVDLIWLYYCEYY
jgi:hypothetical protein